MTRKYTLVIDGKPGAYGAYLPEIETILITGRTIDEITARAKKAIRLYWEHAPQVDAPPARVRTIEVEVPAQNEPQTLA
jgi:predicted RNase H-like HicB family nuclease